MILLSLLFCGTSDAAESVTQIDRYLTVQNKSTNEQTDLLSQIVQVHFPPTLQTIGDVMKYLLNFSGYTLVDEKDLSPAARIMIVKSLPTVLRSIGPIPLRKGLETLAGKGFYLMEDPINRTVNFKLKNSYQRFVKRG